MIHLRKSILYAARHSSISFRITKNSCGHVFREGSRQRRFDRFDNLSRNFSSLAGSNPMFPERPLKEPTNDSQQGKGKDDDFLSKHGGKVGVVALAVSIYLISTYFMEPAEINEIRDSNHLSLEKYHTILGKVIQTGKWYNGSSLYGNTYGVIASDFEADIKMNGEVLGVSYDDFVNIVRSEHQMKLGHLFDRWVSCSKSTSSDTNEIAIKDRIFPVTVLMSLLGLALSSHIPSATRISCYYSLCRMWQQEQLKHSNAGVSTAMTSTGTRDDDSIEPISLESVKLLIEALLSTDQIPAEKRVIETDVKYPFKKHRPKHADELVREHLKASKPPLEDVKELTFEQFHDLLLGSRVCIWGECYRRE